MTTDRIRNEQDLTGLLSHVTRAYRKVVNRMLAAQGMSDSQALPVLFIARLGDGVRPGVLADHVGVEGPSLVRQLDQLCAAGLVERRDDPLDRRAKTLHLTPAGRDQAVLLESMLRDLRSGMLAGLTDEALSTTLEALRRFDAALAGDLAYRG